MLTAAALLLSACGGGDVPTTEVTGPDAVRLRYTAQASAAPNVHIQLSSESLPPLPQGLQPVSAFHQFTPAIEVESAQLQLPLQARSASPRLMQLGSDGAWHERRAEPSQDGGLVAQLSSLGAVVAVDTAADAPQRAAQASAATTATGTPTIAEFDVQPQSISVTAGMGGTFSAVVRTAPLTKLDWLSAPGTGPGAKAIVCTPTANPSACQFTNAQAVHHGSKVWLRVHGNGAFKDSAVATLSVTPQGIAPSVPGLAPADTTVEAGRSLTLTASATGTAPLSWQWLRDGVPIVGANSPSLLISTLSSDAGRQWTYALRVSNPFGTAVSANRRIAVTAPAGPVITALQGGSVPAPNAMSVDIPPGALTADTQVSLTEEEVPAGLLPAGASPIGKVLKLGANGLNLKAPAALRFPLPDALAPDEAVAVLELEDSAQVRAMAAGSAARRPSGLAVTGGWRCLNRQNADVDNRISGSLGRGASAASSQRSSRALVVRTITRHCTFVEPRVTAPGVPSITDQACTLDDDFIAASGAQALVSRHVACLRGQDVGTEFQARVQDQRDSQGRVTGWLPVTDAAAGASDRSIGNGRIVAKLSLHGPSNVLQKQALLELGIAQFISDPNVPSSFAPAARSLRLQALIRVCASECSTTRSAPVTLPLGGGSVRVETAVPLPDPGAGQQHTVTVSIDKVLYALQGNDLNESFRFFDPVLGTLPPLTCDNGLARARTKGCVFEDAAAVFVLDNGVPYSRDHVLQAIRRLDMLNLGLYEPMPDHRASASPAAAGRALVRTRDLARIKANRNASAQACPTPAEVRAACELPADDPDAIVDQGPCDCDEYAFASTRQGAFGREPAEFSVKRIPAADNRRAGAALGAFYTRQRIKDGSNFWVKPQ